MRLLGSMLTTRIFLGAMSRANLSGPELAKLPHFYFYVDEFQNFANETFAEILSESRKYRLNLIIAHQYVEQMEEEVRDAVFGNVGTTVVFRVGPFDAEMLETVFMPKFTKEDIVSLDKRQIYLSLMIDGVGSAPFSAVTIPPIEAPPVSYKEQVIESSREQFTALRAGIENSIIEELAASAASEAPADARMKRRPPTPQKRIEKAPELAAPPQSVAPAPTNPTPPTPPARPAYVAPRPPKPSVAPQPIAAGKSAEDLKAILRNMTAKTGAEKEKKQSQHQQSLKGALTDIITRNQPAAQQPPPPEKMLPAAPAPQPVQATVVPQQKQPFEVPEDALRKVLRGEV